MKRITNLISLCTLIVFGAYAQIKTPQPSPAGSVSSTVGLTEVKVDYYRPGVKGRKIFGDGDDFLVPYGQIWRTGANAGTIVSFDTDVRVAGQDVKAGEYQMVTKPGANQWDVMLISEPIGGNMSNYNEEKVVANASVTPQKSGSSVERMSFQIADISADNTTANIQFSWSDVMWNLPIEVSYHEAVMKDIAAKTQVPPQNYVAAANYYLNTDGDLEQALEWMDKYLAIGDNANQFWNVYVKAQILAKMGKKKEAIATAKDSMEKAKNFPSGDFGYIKRNQDLIDSLQ